MNLLNRFNWLVFLKLPIFAQQYFCLGKTSLQYSVDINVSILIQYNEIHLSPCELSNNRDRGYAYSAY